MIECGGGSAAALHEVQKYPADYNGVVVGGHAAHLTRQIFGQLWLWQATHPNGVAILPAAKLPVIHDAVLAKVRSAGRGEGRTARESDPLHVRPEGNRVHGRRRTELPDRAAGRSGAEDLRGTDQSPDERADLVAALSRQRAGLEFLHRRAEPHRHRDERAARRDSRRIRPGTIGRPLSISTATSRWRIGRTSRASTRRTPTSRNTCGEAEN